MLQMRKRFLDMCAEELDNVAGAELIEQTEAEVKYLEEEAIKQEMNIAQDIAAIEELTEDINVIQDQLGENDKKLTDPDIVVTAVDVEVSEECYKALAFKHGIRNINAIRFSSESVLDNIKAEPRRYLSMSNEGLKDIFIKIWEKIKAFFKKIGEKLGLVEKAKVAKAKNVVNEAKEVVKEIEALPSEIKKEKIKEVIYRYKDSEEIKNLFSTMKEYPFFYITMTRYHDGGKELCDERLAANTLKNGIQCVRDLMSLIKDARNGKLTGDQANDKFAKILENMKRLTTTYEKISKFFGQNDKYWMPADTYPGTKKEIQQLLLQGNLTNLTGKSGHCIKFDNDKNHPSFDIFKFEANTDAYNDITTFFNSLKQDETLEKLNDMAKEISKLSISDVESVYKMYDVMKKAIDESNLENIDSGGNEIVFILKGLLLAVKSVYNPMLKDAVNANYWALKYIKELTKIVKIYRVKVD